MSSSTTQDEGSSPSPKNNRIRTSLDKLDSDETEKLIISDSEVVKNTPAKFPSPSNSSSNRRRNTSSDFEIVIQKFDPDMFDKFETRQLQFRRSSQEAEQSNSDVDKLVQEIHNSIDQHASKTLFSWHNLPIIFPPPIADISNIDLDSLFKFPTFDELDEVAVDATGKRKRLNDQQFESIKRLGEFEVDSNRFEGKKHKWVLSRLLQKGYENSNNSFFKDMSNSLHLLIVTAKRRFYYRYFSVLDGLKSIGRSIFDFIDLFIGLPQMRTVDYYAKLNLEKIKFLVAELKIDPSQEEAFNKLCSQLNLALEKDVYSREKWSFPHFYKGPDNLVVDLRLYDNELQKQIAPILKDLLKIDSNERVFLNNLRDESIILFANEGLKENEIRERTMKIVYKEYLKRLYNRLASSSSLESISPGIGKLLCEHVQAIRAIEQVCDEIVNEFNTHMKAYEDRLRKEHRVRSLVSEWLQEQLDNEKERYLKEKSFLVHQKAMEKCGEERLFQATYFIIREMIFYRDHEKDWIKKFKKVKEPTKVYHFHRYIWFPKNYIIEKNSYTNEYIAKKEIEYKSDNKYPFWRWKNFFIRTAVYLSNLFFIFGIVIPFASPVSFSALFLPNPFYPGKQVNRKTGQLEVDSNSKTLTYLSRLRSIWSHVRKSIDEFESIPDKGLISKNVQRIFNRTWNYVIKGFLGSLGLTLIFPPICLISSIGSLILFVLSPIWFPILNLLGHLCLILIFDVDYAFTPRVLRFFKIVIFDLLLRGIAQPIAALITATIICPLVSFILLIFGVCRKGLRKTWDSFMFYAVIKRQAKIPSSDTFLARRVAGPGLSSSYFYQARAEQVLVTLETHLEAKMLRAYFGFIERGLRRPLNTYTKFFNPLFNRYSYHLEMTRGPYMDLNSNVNHYINIYQKEMNKRTQILDKAIQDPKIKNIRLVEKDLDPLLIEATKVVKKHYEEILKYQQKEAKVFFEEKGMSLNDWEGLTKIELEDLFGVGIITPLEQTDVYFSLNVDHLNLSKYSKMIADSNIRDDLDVVHVNYNPKRSRNPTFQVEEEKIELFDPKREFNTKCGLRDLKNHSAWTKMTIPTKLPGHLGVTALLVEHMNKASENQEKFKYTYDQVINAVNRNETEANKLV